MLTDTNKGVLIAVIFVSVLIVTQVILFIIFFPDLIFAFEHRSEIIYQPKLRVAICLKSKGSRIAFLRCFLAEGTICPKI